MLKCFKRLLCISLTVAVCTTAAFAATVTGTVATEKVINDSFAVFYRDGEISGVTYSNKDNSEHEILGDNTLKVKCVKENGGIAMSKVSEIGLTNEIAENAYFCFDIKVENMATKTIRALVWSGEGWSPTEFGMWQYNIADTTDWQTIKIPLKEVADFATRGWSAVRGIRIDPYEPWNAVTISSSNPAYMYLKNVRIRTEIDTESTVSTSLVDDAGADVNAITAGGKIKVKLDYNNQTDTKTTNAVAFLAVYDSNDIMVELLPVETGNVSPGGSDTVYSGVYTFGSNVEGYSLYVITCDSFGNMQAVCDAIYMAE